MKAVSGFLSRTPFVRNVAVLVTGTAAAQALTMLAYPILMRLFDPADFGLFALFGAIVMTVAVVASLRYELAIVLARNEREAVNVLALALGIVAVISVLSVVVMMAGGDALMRLLGTEHLDALLAWLPVSIFCASAYTVLSYWATRQKLFKRLSISNVCRSFGVAVAQIGLGLARTGAGGLVVGQILGQIVAVLALSSQIIRRDWRRFRTMLSWREMRRLARVHRDFPLYNAPRALLNSTTITVPSILLATLFGADIAGLYWFAYRLLEMPMTLLGDATRRVFYQRAAELNREGHGLTDIFVRTSAGLGMLAAGPTVLLMLAAPWLFEIAFGPAWRESGVYMQWLVAWWFFRFVNLPSIMMIPLLGLPRAFLILEAVILVPRLLVIPLAAQFADAYTAIIGYSIVGLCFHMTSTFIVWRCVRRNDARLRDASPMPA